jgi:hypothetical protein
VLGWTDAPAKPDLDPGAGHLAAVDDVDEIVGVAISDRPVTEPPA